MPLHGDLSPQEQDAAVRPGTRRKVILSTNVAESSVTIEGVVAVIDSGLARVASQAPWSGLPRLRVEKVSRASATQRAGRAGRTRPGRCLRLYTRADLDARPEHEAPEIRRLDLTQTMLELAAAGAGDVPWLEPPPEAHVRAARELLGKLGALDSAGALTATGRSMLRFAVHPRAARVVVEGERRGVSEDACVAAALLAEGDIRAASRARFGEGRAHDAATEASDVVALVDLFREAEDARFREGALRAAGLDAGATRAVSRAAEQLSRARAPWRGILRQRRAGPSHGPSRRLPRSRGAPGASGRSLRSPSRAEGWPSCPSRASCATRSGWWPSTPKSAPTALAAAPSCAWPAPSSPSGCSTCTRTTSWSAARSPGTRAAERVAVRDTMTYGGLVLHASESPDARGEDVSRVLAEAALAAGPSDFAAADALDRWLLRARFAASVSPSMSAPDDAAVRATLVSLCEGRRSFAELREAGLLDALRGSMGRGAQDVDRLAPERVTLASGRSCVVRYELGKPPAIASRMQDFFGMSEGPRIGGGKVPLVLELNAPSGRAQQVTTDLAGFWQRHYPSIRGS